MQSGLALAPQRARPALNLLDIGLRVQGQGQGGVEVGGGASARFRPATAPHAMAEEVGLQRQHSHHHHHQQQQQQQNAAWYSEQSLPPHTPPASRARSPASQPLLQVRM
jgi:hypothetical protein